MAHIFKTPVEIDTLSVDTLSVDELILGSNTEGTLLTAQQAEAINTNSDKVGITEEQAAAIATNSAKVGFSPAINAALDEFNYFINQNEIHIQDNTAFRFDNTSKLDLIDFSGSLGTSTNLPRIVYGPFPLISLQATSSLGYTGVRIEQPFSATTIAEFDGEVLAYSGLEAGPLNWQNNPSNQLTVRGDGTIFRDLLVVGDIEAYGYITAGQDIKANGDVIAFFQSDKRLKDNIKPIENTLDKVSKLGGYEFDWNDKQDTYEGHDIGVIAQEVEEVFPELVTTRDNGYKAVKYEKLVAVLISAVNELKEEIEQLKSK